MEIYPNKEREQAERNRCKAWSKHQILKDVAYLYDSFSCRSENNKKAEEALSALREFTLLGLKAVDECIFSTEGISIHLR